MSGEVLEGILGFDPTTPEGAKIREALTFAEMAHHGQVRASGEPYIAHPMAVAQILADLHMDSETIVAALLHDVVEDTDYTYQDIEERFGTSVATLVDGVTKLDRLQMRSREEEQAENLRKMFLAMAKDIRVILIKLADRLHNMRTLKHLDAERVHRIARETMDIYAPLAHRLGIFRIKWELEDLAFFHLEPDKYQETKLLVAQKRRQREAAVDEVLGELTRRIEPLGIRFEVTGRAKHLFSIYQKMEQRGKHFSEIYDLVAVRVLVETVRDCYAVLGMVHSVWKPVPGRFKDYIAMPKSNGYQSLHTTVIGPRGERLEVQIRTFEMHYTAEYGIAAHWRYKEGTKSDRDYDQKLVWLRQLLDWQRDVADATEFVETLKVDLFADEVFVFTPKGDVMGLPSGSTPIDFAYRIHTDVGHHCVGAKVNGHIVPLSTALQNGDLVEVLVNRNSAGPSADWLNIVRTPQSKNRIRSWLRKERRQEHLERGREALEREMRRQGVVLEPERLQELLRRLGYGELNELAMNISDGSVAVGQVITRVREEIRRQSGPAEPTAPRRRPSASPSEVLVRGQPHMLTRLAHCCQPVPGDPIIGYLTRGRGITVHRIGCRTQRELEKEAYRFIEVSWQPTEEPGYHTVRLAIYARDRAGLLADITAVVADSNIISAQAQGFRNQTAVVNLVLEVRNLSQLNRIIGRLQALPHIERIERDSGQSAVGP